MRFLPPCFPQRRGVSCLHTSDWPQFDRQWIVADNRLINQPNPELWEGRSERQVYLTAFSRLSPSSGPALTVTGHIPDLHHYKGSFGGRVFPLWRDRGATISNVRPNLLAFLSSKFGVEVGAEDIVAYVVATTAHPAFTARFQDDLSTPGLRVPLTADRKFFFEASELGRTVIWLHTFGERMTDPEKGRPAQPPRLPAERRPHIPSGGAIPEDPAAMPDTIGYNASLKRLLVGAGYLESVEPGVWQYEVSGKQVLLHWFSYRKANRERPILGDRRPPSPLGSIQPDHWLAEYTTELINLLNVLGLLVDLQPAQARLLEGICAGPMFSADELRAAGAFEVPAEPRLTRRKPEKPSLFE